MAYNLALKKYANGTIQLTYYDYPVLDGYDKAALDYDIGDAPLFEELREYDDGYKYTPWGYYDDIIEMGGNKIDTNLKNTVLSDEELAERHKRSIASSLNRSIRRIYDLGRNNIWDWFFTFTLNENSVIDRKDYSECSKKVCKWFNNLRLRKCPNIKYLIVPEQHPTSGAWHFHALVSGCEELSFKVAVNNQKFRKDENGDLILDKHGKPKLNKYYGQALRVKYPDGNYIYNIENFNIERYGFSQATRITDTRRAVSYIVKYLTKDLSECTFGKQRYFPSRNLTIPERETVIIQKSTLQDAINWVEQNYDVKLEADYIKTVTINQPNYNNVVSYLEFNKNVTQS